MDNYYDIQEHLLESWNTFSKKMSEIDCFLFDCADSPFTDARQIPRDHPINKDENVLAVLVQYYLLDNGVSAKNKCTILNDCILNNAYDQKWPATTDDFYINETAQQKISDIQQQLETLEKRVRAFDQDDDTYEIYYMTSKRISIASEIAKIKKNLYTHKNPSAFFCTVLQPLIDESCERCDILNRGLQIQEPTVQVEISEDEKQQRLTMQQVLDKRISMKEIGHPKPTPF